MTTRHAYTTVHGQDIRLTPARGHHRFPRRLKQVLKAEAAADTAVLALHCQGPDDGTWAHLTPEYTATPAATGANQEVTP